MKNLIFPLLCCVVAGACAQDTTPKKSNIPATIVAPAVSPNMANVVFSKRVWEDIDLSEKLNNHMANPQTRLVDILVNAISSGELVAYDARPSKNDPDGDSFAKALSPIEAKGRLIDSSLVMRRDANNNVISSAMTAMPYNAGDIVKFRIKEDYYFDKQRSVFEPKIVGIAPMFKHMGIANADYTPAFWIYFPSAKPVLAANQVVDADNVAVGLTYDELFTKHIFQATIVKQTGH